MLYSVSDAYGNDIQRMLKNFYGVLNLWYEFDPRKLIHKINPKTDLQNRES